MVSYKDVIDWVSGWTLYDKSTSKAIFRARTSQDLKSLHSLSPTDSNGRGGGISQREL